MEKEKEKGRKGKGRERRGGEGKGGEGKGGREGRQEKKNCVRKSGTKRMINGVGGSELCEEGQGKWLGVETALCWLIQGQPDVAGIQYSFLLFPGLGEGGGYV